jgi:tetratricopeptide (TPR) repeat protein
MRTWQIIALALWAAAGALMAEEGKKEERPAAADAAKLQKVHQYLSAECFNNCWKLIEKANRSPEDVQQMLLLAHTSLWHWQQRADCKPLNVSVGYWQLSRVYALAGEYSLARRFGEECLKVGERNALAPFYIGYAYEALARAELLNKDLRKAAEHLAKARGQLEKVTDKEERGLLKADLEELGKQTPRKPDAGGGK